jgi:hypothetical protein
MAGSWGDAFIVRSISFLYVRTNPHLPGAQKKAARGRLFQWSHLPS